MAKCDTSRDSFKDRENGPAGIATMKLYEIRGCVEPMPPSGSKPTGGAVDVYGHHEFRLRFALKMAAL